MTTSGLRPGEKHGVKSECSACGEVFCGVSAFDDHRVGEHGVNRRCLSSDEMAVQGMTRCSLGRWSAVSSRATRAKTAGTRSDAALVEAAS